MRELFKWDIHASNVVLRLGPVRRSRRHDSNYILSRAMDRCIGWSIDPEEVLAAQPLDLDQTTTTWPWQLTLTGLTRRVEPIARYRSCKVRRGSCEFGANATSAAMPRSKSGEWPVVKVFTRAGAVNLFVSSSYLACVVSHSSLRSRPSNQACIGP